MEVIYDENGFISKVSNENKSFSEDLITSAFTAANAYNSDRKAKADAKRAKLDTLSQTLKDNFTSDHELLIAELEKKKSILELEKDINYLETNLTPVSKTENELYLDRLRVEHEIKRLESEMRDFHE
jgi:hypothetical protein